MALFRKTGEFYDNLKDELTWNLRFSNPQMFLSEIQDKIGNLERGTEYPLYFPKTGRFLKSLLAKEVSLITEFVKINESELNKHRLKDWAYSERFNYFVKNFYYFSNSTLNNLYYYSNTERAHLQKVKYHYNILNTLWLASFLVFGASSISITNYFFRTRQSNISTALISSVVVYLSLFGFYNFSDITKNYFLNNTVRRLGYGHLTSRSLKRNVELSLH